MNAPESRALIRGVITAAIRAFGEACGVTEGIVAQKSRTTGRYRFELLGVAEDTSQTTFYDLNAGLRLFGEGAQICWP